MKYLRSVDGARFLRRSGSVLTLKMVALRKEIEKRDTSQQQRPKVTVGCSNYGVAHSSRLRRGGNRESKRQRQRLKWEFVSDDRTVSPVLVRSQSLDLGGSNPRTLETIGKLQIL